MTKLDYFYVAGWSSTLSGLYESTYDGALRVAGSAREARVPRFVHVRPLVNKSGRLRSSRRIGGGRLPAEAASRSRRVAARSRASTTIQWRVPGASSSMLRQS